MTGAMPEGWSAPGHRRLRVYIPPLSVVPDLRVDGVSLSDAVRHGWPGGVDASWVRSQLGEGPAALPDTVLLAVCPQCGDLGCGAVAARVIWAEGTVTWSDFQWIDEDGLEPAGTDLVVEDLAVPGFPERFVFDRDQYVGELRRALGR
ncbi:hypothetical protein DWB68_08315 [Galactobacter valiniphilus]|uniref:Uncharacterized protein n=1 Tax=Galactobacter valiniphilus TaxID=2676122 RepID=A0A399J9I7_9MICC|nr:hypothetical protein [Galactobacter valiniphilus]RII42225.1 hypothetical protein DWB68_08315 [Galactobacter valiniphilus]